jgi:hypothetical protein
VPGLFYYPKINAPRDVIHQALLYWDRLLTITPPGPLDDVLDDRMRQVNDAGLYTALPADRWPNPMRLERSLTLLTRLIDRIPVRELDPGEGPDTYVYRGKFSSSLLDQLDSLGLTRSVGRDRFRIQVSAAVQLCLISVAARDIAAAHRMREDDRMVYPHTDSVAADLFARSVVAGDEQEGRPTWQVEIGGLLPVPGYEVSISDLMAFRQRHDDERRRLITAVDRLVHELRRDHEHAEDVLAGLRTELDQAVADLEQAGRSARITWVRRPITVAIALAAGYAGQRLVPDAGWLLGVVGGAAINVATNTTQRACLGEAEDFSYLHRVQTALA